MSFSKLDGPALIREQGPIYGPLTFCKYKVTSTRTNRKVGRFQATKVVLSTLPLLPLTYKAPVKMSCFVFLCHRRLHGENIAVTVSIQNRPVNFYQNEFTF